MTRLTWNITAYWEWLRQQQKLHVTWRLQGKGVRKAVERFVRTQKALVGRERFLQCVEYFVKLELSYNGAEKLHLILLQNVPLSSDTQDSVATFPGLSTPFKPNEKTNSSVQSKSWFSPWKSGMKIQFLLLRGRYRFSVRWKLKNQERFLESCWNYACVSHVLLNTFSLIGNIWTDEKSVLIVMTAYFLLSFSCSLLWWYKWTSPTIHKSWIVMPCRLIGRCQHFKHTVCIFCPEVEGSMFVWNVSIYLWVHIWRWRISFSETLASIYKYTQCHPRSWSSPPQELQISQNLV